MASAFWVRVALVRDFFEISFSSLASVTSAPSTFAGALYRGGLVIGEICKKGDCCFKIANSYAYILKFDDHALKATKAEPLAPVARRSITDATPFHSHFPELDRNLHRL